MSIDRVGLVVGGIRLASGVSFLVAPARANRLWGDPEKPTGSTWLLLHSMGYRDALIGGLLAAAAPPAASAAGAASPTPGMINDPACAAS